MTSPRFPVASAEAPYARLSGRRVLVAEDSQINQMLVEEWLGEVGMSVTLALDGAQALERLAVETFDLVLMDCRMPLMDGYTATRRLRERWPDLPVIALTGNAHGSERDEGIASGMNEVLVKPLQPQQLLDCLVRWLPPVPAGDAPGACER